MLGKTMCGMKTKQEPEFLLDKLDNETVIT